MVGFDPERSKQLSKTGQGMAGSTSGAITRSILQPLDVLKIRFQLQVEPIGTHQQSHYHGMLHGVRTIAKEEGITAFWKGHIPAQMLSIVFGGVQFVSFEVLTKQVWERFPTYFTTDLRPVTHFLCGGLAGCAATLAGQPFDVIRTRFVAQGDPKIYKSMAQACRSMVVEEGPRALYKGLLPTLVQIAPHTGLQFGFYTLFRGVWNRLFGKPQKNKSDAVATFACGFCAGSCAKIVVYPLDLVKKRLQVQGFKHFHVGFKGIPEYRGLLHCVTRTLQEEGPRGLYKGLGPSLVKATLATGLHFSVYEQCCHLLSTTNWFR